ncbi:MAG: TRAM domain-containing protein [Methylophilaceae bacterium]
MQEIQSLINEQGKNHTHALMNSEQRVLIDEKVDDITFKGKTDNNRIVEIKTKQDILNQMVKVKVIKTTDRRITGELI